MYMMSCVLLGALKSYIIYFIILGFHTILIYI